MKQYIVGCVIAVFLLVGCAATQQEGAAKAMLISKTAIVDIAVSANDLCTAGTLKQEDCTKIGEAYEKAKVHYDIAETALATAIKSDTEGTWENYNVLHENFARIYGDLLALALSYGINPEVE